MGVLDTVSGRVSDALGGALGFVGNVAADSFEKASREVAKNRDGYPGDLPAGLPEPAREEPKSLLFDPFAVIDQLGYKDKPSGVTYSTLADISRRVPVIAAILQTRINQIGNFALPQPDDREPGFKLTLRDKDRPPTKKEKQRADDVGRWLLNTGSSQSLAKDTFETFLRKLVRDSLTYDQATFEIVANEKGEPADFYAVDAATIRIADLPAGAEFEDDPDRARYVQIYDDVVIAELGLQDMCFGVRNPRTGVRLNGYGFSEIEQLLSTVTAMLWAFQYNQKFFSAGSATKGVLNFKGSIPDSKLDAFRRHWYAMITGVQNAWRTPITNAEELQWINLHASNRDMEFSAFFDFLIKVACGVFQFDPSEINFTYGNSGQSSQMFQAPAEQRIKSSKDRGLRPLLRSLASWINRYLVWPIEPDMELQFTGINPKDASEVIDQEKKQVSYKMTVDELRAEDDLAPLPDGKGEVILDPTWLQYAQAKDMEAQQEAQGGEEGGGWDEAAMGGEEGGEGAGGPQGAPPAEGGGWPADMGGPEQGGWEDAGKSETFKKARVVETRTPKTRTYEIEL
ncbi:MAG: phage portal protein [Gammaproteobacteria bacterium]|nr:phage portal protein [Gammaproteobacteria bacterium]